MIIRFFKILFQSLFLTINFVVVILFVLAAFSDHVPPEKSLFFSYLGLGFPILFFLNLFFIFYWGFVARWKYLFISLLSILICFRPVINYFPFHRQAKEISTEGVLKVLTYNVMSFAFKGHTPEEPNEIVQYIADSGADIVCMQEYADNNSEKYMNTRQLRKLLPMYPYYSVIELQKSNHHKAGLAVFSKYPISNSRRIPYESSNNGSSIHEININGKKLTLINNHLESFKLTMEDKKRYKEFLNSAGAETLDGLAGTIQGKLGPAFIERAGQARVVASEIDKIDSGYILVCGDFNDTPISYARREIQGNLLDAFSTSGRGLGITYNENFFWFRIDHILYSSNMKAINCTVDKVKYSDHYPVWSYFQLN